jgi:hypothetical protein
MNADCSSPGVFGEERSEGKENPGLGQQKLDRLIFVLLIDWDICDMGHVRRGLFVRD